MFEHILLEQEQKDLLVMLVEAARNTPREQRQPFMLIQSFDGSALLHAGLGAQRISVYKGDVEALTNERLLTSSYTSQGILKFDVSPRGFKYYEELKQQVSQPLERIEVAIRHRVSLVTHSTGLSNSAIIQLCNRGEELS